MAKAKVRKLKEKGAGKTRQPAKGQTVSKEAASAVTPSAETKPSTSEKPEPVKGDTKETIVPTEPAPAACEVPAKVEVGTKEAPPPSEKPVAPRVKLTSRRDEFSLAVGSPSKARYSMVNGYLAMVFAPTIILLAIIAPLKSQDMDGSESLIASMEFMLWTVAILGIPIMAVSWFFGFYPSGSYGRLVAGSLFAVLLGLSLILVLIASGLEDAIADLGVSARLNWLFTLLCLTPIFFFGQAASEFRDDRRTWLKGMGVDTRKVRIDLKSKFLDFNHHLGRCKKGIASAWLAYMWFIVMPIMLLANCHYLLNEVRASRDLVESIDSMFGTVLLFGTPLVFILFLRGFYPCGSLSRATFGLLVIPVLTAFAWKVLIGSGMEGALAQNYLIIDMTLMMLPVLMYVFFISVFELSELVDGRRAYRRWIGLPVKDFNPGETYSKINDFDPFYASYSSGTRKGREILTLYAVKLFIITAFFAVGMSVFLSPSSADMNERLRSYLDPEELDPRLDRIVLVLVLLAMANTAGVFLAWSYREGSFARLLMSAEVAAFASQWAYYFWSSLAKIFKPSDFDQWIYAIMFASLGLIVFRATRAIYKGYLKSRNKYVDWRLALLKKDVPAAVTPLPSSAQPSPSTSPGNINGRGA